jgi:hypothetical protein
LDGKRTTLPNCSLTSREARARRGGTDTDLGEQALATLAGAAGQTGEPRGGRAEQRISIRRAGSGSSTK